MSSDSRQQVWDVFAKAMETFDQKNADYGDAWRRNGWRGNLSRVFEKADRVRNLAWRPDPRVPAVGDEQVLETLQDMLNTTAFAIINLIEEVEYGHEVPRSQRVAVAGLDYVPGAGAVFFEQVSAEISHGHDEPITTRMTVSPEALEQARQDGHRVQNSEELSLMQIGLDEQSAAEKKHTPRKRVVRDNP